MQWIVVTVSVALALTISQVSGQAATIKGTKGTGGSISSMGGGITVYRDLSVNGSNKTVKTAEISVSFLRLTELSSDLKPVMDKNNKTHTFGSFEKQAFTCQAQPNNNMMYSSSVKADCWYCSTGLPEIFSSVVFRINACVVQNNGTITQGTEVSNVTEGQLKLSIEMTKGWPWCDASCTGGNGKFLDLDIGVKLPPGFKRAANVTTIRTDNRPVRFELGSGVTAEFSAMSLVDSQFVKLAENTPALIQQNSSSTVTLRFNRFENSLTYDPTFDTGTMPYDPNSSARFAAISLPALLLVAMVTVWLTSLSA